MVAPQQIGSSRVGNFVCEEQKAALNSLDAAVHIVTQKQVAHFRAGSPVFLEKVEQIVKLAVNVAHNRDGFVLYLDKIRFILKDIQALTQDLNALFLAKPALLEKVLLEH
jgi:hypothetical protein